MHHPFNFIHYLETPATIAGLLDVYLVSRANIWNFFFGIITVTLYGVIFWQAKLYADMTLQLVFLCFQFYGLYHWLYGGKRHAPLTIRKANFNIYISAAIAVIILFISYAFILKNYTDSTTIYIDAFTTAMSLVAQWMLSKKWYEHWLLWITVDIISIKMYLIKHLYLTSGLYCVFLTICCIGFYQWRKQVYSSKLNLA
jgi:nicotinamide mononucleotide transporter